MRLSTVMKIKCSPFLLTTTILLAFISRYDAALDKDTKEQIESGLSSGKDISEAISKIGDPKKHKVFKTLGKMAGFLGAVGGFVSFILAFIPQESEELRYMKEKFAEVNTKLDRITQQLDNMENLITLQTQKAAYIHDSNKILYGYSRILPFINAIQKAKCSGNSGQNGCNAVRARIASNYVNDFNVKQNLFSIINGATGRTSAFSEPLLKLIQVTYKCDMVKIDQFTNGVLKLAFKAQQVILMHERLRGNKDSIVTSINEWVTSMERLRDTANAYKNSCYKHIKSYMIADIRDSSKYQAGSSSNQQAITKLKNFLDRKYTWLNWVVLSYDKFKKNEKDKYHSTSNKDGAFKSLPNAQKRNIIVASLDKGTYRNKYTIIDRINTYIRSQNARTKARKLYYGSARTIHDFIVEGLKLKDMWKYVKSLTILKKYPGFNIQVNKAQKTAVIERVFSGTFYYSRRTRKYNFKAIIVLYSNDILSLKGCPLTCNYHGKCKNLPYSSTTNCQCSGSYVGNQCKIHIKAKLAKTISTILTTTLRIPVMSDIYYQIKDLQVFLAAGLSKVQKTIGKIEQSMESSFKRLEAKLINEFKWQKLATHYGKIIRDVKYYTNVFERFASLTKSERNVHVNYVLGAQGAERWLFELNYLVIGRQGSPVVSHDPLLFTFMEKHKGKACTIQYKKAMEAAWQQLILLQTQAKLILVQARDYKGLPVSALAKKFNTVLQSQQTRMKQGTCDIVIPHSTNLNCKGKGFYMIPRITVRNSCTSRYFVAGSLTTTCKNPTSSCQACNCNYPHGSNSQQCSNIQGQCPCKPNFYGKQCRNRNCRWGPWRTLSCCGYGDTKKYVRNVVITKQGGGRNCPGSNQDLQQCRRGCCPGKFDCSRLRKCIASSKRCDYDNDCGDSQDEQHCRERCTTHYTRWNHVFGGRSMYLDRHDVNCGNKLLKGFRLQRRRNGNIRYIYTCCQPHKDICAMTHYKYTGYTDAGRSNGVFLDRQHVNCGKHSYMTSFKLEYLHKQAWSWNRLRQKDHLRYRFKCCNLRSRAHQHRTRCYWRHTHSARDHGGRIENLRHLNVYCHLRYFLNDFRLKRRGHHHWFYRYRCCKINP